MNGASVSSQVDEAWEAEMAQALRNLDDEIEIVRQARELREANEDKDEDEDEDDEDVDDEDELEAIENSEEKSFLGNEGVRSTFYFHILPNANISWSLPFFSMDCSKP